MLHLNNLLVFHDLKQYCILGLKLHPSARAKKNWNDLLLARASELRPNGRLVMLNFGIDEEGRYLGNTGGVNMFDTFNDLWRSMRDEGIISNDEFVNTAFPQYYRTVEEFCAPLKDKDSAVYQAGLRLVSAHTGVVKCPYRRAYDESEGEMSARAFAKSYVPTLRSWSEAVFLSGLDDQRPLEELRRSCRLRSGWPRHGLRTLLYRNQEGRPSAVNGKNPEKTAREIGML